MNKISHLTALCFILLWSSWGNIHAQGWFKKSPKKIDTTEVSLGNILIPQLILEDQNGQAIEFHKFIKDKIVVINFIFTKCKTICPPMGANFAKLVREVNCLDPNAEKVKLISISIDPRNDKPERLKKWSEHFGAPENWTLLTGNKNDIDQLLKELKVYTPLKEDHSPIIMMGEEGKYNWIRTNGLAPVEKLYASIEKLVLDQEQPTDDNYDKDVGYFTNTTLIDQNGNEFQFYDDLLKDKIVVINPFFGDCKGSCPKMHHTLMSVQQYLGNKLGEEVLLLSITVDPIKDSPARLAQYASLFEARPGWHFLSGKEENVHLILKKLGKYVAKREQHDTIMLIGNTKTRLWKKVNGLSDASEIIEILDSVIYDRGT